MSYLSKPSTISTLMRDILIEHLDGVKVPFSAHQRYGEGLESIKLRHRIASTTALLARGYIRKVDQNRFTVITDEGRLKLGKLLADYAESLVSAYQMLGKPVDPKWLESLSAMFLVDREGIVDRELV